MNTLWIPVCITLISITEVVCDIHDENERRMLRGELSLGESFKKEWVSILFTLSMRPGIFLFAVWFVWLNVLR